MHTSDKILEDMLELSAQVILYVELKRIPYALKDQLIRSTSSMGASYSDAQNASSKRDFTIKIYLAKKAAGEARYWLKLVERLLDEDDELPVLQQAVQGFTMMLQKIINTSKENTGTGASNTQRALSTSTR